jgi:hypothetical protein
MISYIIYSYFHRFCVVEISFFRRNKLYLFFTKFLFNELLTLHNLIASGIKEMYRLCNDVVLNNVYLIVLIAV